MRRIISLLILFCLTSVEVWAQQGAIGGIPGVIDANAEAVTLRNLNGRGSAKVQTTGTYSGTWEAQCSVDGTTFDTDDELLLTLVGTSTTAVEVTSNAEAIWDINNIAGCSAVRVIATAWTSGTLTVRIVAAPTGGGGGGGGGGDVTSNSENIATEATLESIDANIDTLVNNLGIDVTHANDVVPSGPQIMGEAKDIDGSALPNVVTEGQAARVATTLSGAVLSTFVNEAGTVAAGVTAQGGLQAALSATTTGGCTPGSIISAASVNETAIKATAGQLYSLNLTNIGANEVFFKLYNDTTANVDETDTPVQRYVLPGSASGAGNHPVSMAVGMAFGTAITFRITSGAVDNDTGAIAASEVYASWCFL